MPINPVLGSERDVEKRDVDARGPGGSGVVRMRIGIYAALCLLVAGVLVGGILRGRSFEEFVASHGHGHHAHEAPRGGVLVELGAHQGHLELLLAPARGSLTAHVLDAHAQSAIPLQAPVLVVEIRLLGEDSWHGLALAPGENGGGEDAAGHSSVFSGAFPMLLGVDAAQVRVPAFDFNGKTVSSHGAVQVKGSAE